MSWPSPWGVDPKTIERWIGGRIPYRRHRYRVASKLGIDEAYLWPGALAAEQVASASESEVLLLYPHRWAVPRDVWGQLFDSAEEEIGVLVYSGMFLVDDPGLLALFRAKATQGVRIRILLGDPDSAEVAMRGALEGIGEALASKIRNAIVLYRPLAGLDGSRSGCTRPCCTTRSSGWTGSCWSTPTCTVSRHHRHPLCVCVRHRIGVVRDGAVHNILGP